MRAAKVIPIPMAAATDPMRMSRLRMWASSWASTPRTCSQFIAWSSPSVTATAALLGLRPVAKAFGCWLGVMYSLGIGMFARAVRSSMIS